MEPLRCASGEREMRGAGGAGVHLASAEGFRSWLLKAPRGSLVGHRRAGSDPLSFYLMSEGVWEEALLRVELPDWARLFQGRIRFSEGGRPRYGVVEREEALHELEYALQPFVVREGSGDGPVVMRRAELLQAHPRLALEIADGELAYLEVRAGERVVVIERQDPAAVGAERD